MIKALIVDDSALIRKMLTEILESDPGITLVQLFAWMTEMIIYRLNKVTDKNFLAFLDLMGVVKMVVKIV